jgi:hypothetical protein
MKNCNRERDTSSSNDNDGLIEVCVFARQRGSTHRAIDVWSGRCGLLNLVQLSDQFGRVVVWDDILGDRAVPQSVREILGVIERYYGFKAVVGANAAVHIGGLDELARSTEVFFNSSDFSSMKIAHERIAVLDLGSCGTTCLHWSDLIPLLRRCYSHLVGVDFCAPQFCGLDPEFQLPHGLTKGQYQTLSACDHWLLANDKSISDQADLSVESRSDAFTAAVEELCGALASAECIHKAFSSPNLTLSRLLHRRVTTAD